MGLFSFLFSKNKMLRTTQEAEAFRARFLEDEELFLKVEQSDDFKRLQELDELVNGAEFKQRRKQVEQLSYKESDCYRSEKQYKAFMKQKSLQVYLSVRDSVELQNYEQMKQTAEYQEYQKLRGMVEAAGFDKKLHANEWNGYRALATQPKMIAWIKFERSKRFKTYCEVKNTNVPQEFEQLAALVQSEEFEERRKFLQNKDRYKTTEDYKLLQEYESLKKRPDFVKYNALLDDSYFNGMRQWELVFEDDFTQGRLDDSRWITRYYAGERFLNDTYGVGEDVQLFTPDNITFNGSAVVLNFRKESVVGKYWDQKLGIRERKYDYSSAMLSTAASFRQQYGRFEAKVKVNRSAVTSCFWMVGDTHIPHVEVVKCQTDGVSLGRKYADKTKIQDDVQFVKKPELGNDYYIFTLEWTAERMVWMINDLVVKEEKENIPAVPMYIVFSLGAHEAPADKNLPVRMEIDWVRGYKRRAEN